VPNLAIKTAIVTLGNQDKPIQGDFILTTAPLGVELGQPFLVETASGTIYPMASVKVMKR
jgi:hypothetical protein